ncbi:MAG: Ig-like domain-containing protein [Clostridia bacterium]|nr:Ig-like domain-containing protein [Clostridia bacterium]
MRRILSCLLVICLLLGSVTFGMADEDAASAEAQAETVSLIEDADTAQDTQSGPAEADEPEAIPAETAEASAEDEAAAPASETTPSESEPAPGDTPDEGGESEELQPEASEEAVPAVQAAFDKGYAGVSRGAQAYKSADSAEKAGTFPVKDSVVYAELVKTTGSADTDWYKLTFDPAGNEYGADELLTVYAQGKYLTALTDEETAALKALLAETANALSYRGNPLPEVQFAAENEAAATDGEAEAYVPAASAPKITVQPQDITANLGDTITISVSASGSSLAYQWQIKNADSDTWTNSKYTVASFNVEFRTAMIGRQYRCVVSNSLGSVTSKAMTVYKYVQPKAPAITVQPQDITANLGDTVTISVGATGTDLSYQWQIKNTGSTVWTDSKYTVASFDVEFRTAMIGRQYRCVVSNSLGSVISKAMTVYEYVPPKAPSITVQPQDITAKLGDTITISVCATGTDLSYQWQIKNADSNIWANSKYTAASFDVEFKSAMIGRKYRCVVSNSVGSVISKAMTVYEYVAPSITVQPQDITATLGDTVTISVGAAGTDISYQWQIKNAGSTVWTDSKYTAASFDVEFRSAMIGRQYRCVVSNSIGSVTSKAMTVYEYIPPRAPTIKVQPQDITAELGDTVTISVVADGTDLTYQWQIKNTDSNTWSDSKYTAASFDVEFKSAMIRRKYRCVVSNSLGTVISKTITVRQVLLITVQPTDISVKDGETVRFTVKTNKTASYQWKVNRRDGSGYVDLTNDGTFSGTKTATLGFNATESMQNYRFRVLVSDDYSSVLSEYAWFTISATPIITQQPQNQAAQQGDTVYFTVKATGAVSYRWQADKNDGEGFVDLTNPYSWTNPDTDTISFMATVARAGYIYRCKITNENGDTYSKTATLTLAAPPVINTQPANVTSETGKTVSFTVKASNVTAYQWQVDRNDGAGFVDMSETSTWHGVKTATLSFEASGARSEYSFRVVVSNAYMSKNSNTVKLTVLPTTVTLSKTSLTMKAGETYTLTATVSPSQSAQGVTWKSSNTSVATVSGGTVTAKGCGTATITVTTNTNNKSATCSVTVNPGSFSVSSATVSGTSVTLKWSSSTGATYYKVTATSSDGTSTRTVSSISALTYTLTGLKEKTTYSIEVAAYTGDYKTSAAKVSVTTGTGDSTVTYRALLIGEENFDPICTRNRGDVGLMRSMISGRKGGTGSAYSKINCLYNLTPSGVQSAISSTFSGADNDDVSLFFIATHGDIYSSGIYAGALSTVDSSGNESYILFSELANWLSAVPGKVIVVIESCGSGAAIYAEGVSENSARSVKDNSASVLSQIIGAFSSADTTLTLGEELIFDAEGNALRSEANTGEFRQSKFYVLAASRYQELSWGTEGGPYNYFTKYLTQGVGTSGSMPADTNSNGETTLHELFTYIKNNCDPLSFTYYGETVHQHVQVYPKNSSFVLFKK